MEPGLWCGNVATHLLCPNRQRPQARGIEAKVVQCATGFTKVQPLAPHGSALIGAGMYALAGSAGPDVVCLEHIDLLLMLHFVVCFFACKPEVCRQEAKWDCGPSDATHAEQQRGALYFLALDVMP